MDRAEGAGLTVALIGHAVLFGVLSVGFLATPNPAELKPQQDIVMTITAADGSTREVTLLSRIDTPIEVDYYRHGGILPFVLRDLLAA